MPVHGGWQILILILKKATRCVKVERDTYGERLYIQSTAFIDFDVLFFSIQHHEKGTYNL